MPGSKAVELYLEVAKLLPEREKLGFGIVAFACTTCNGMPGAFDPKIQQEIIDRDLYATAVLSGNRNFDGSIHPYAKLAFLASPPLVVAHAIACTIRFDIEKDTLGTDEDGKPVYLKDLWPTDEEIDAIVAQSVKPEQFRKVYEPMFAATATNGETADLLARAMSMGKLHHAMMGTAAVAIRTAAAMPGNPTFFASVAF